MPKTGDRLSRFRPIHSGQWIANLAHCLAHTLSHSNNPINESSYVQKFQTSNNSPPPNMPKTQMKKAAEVTGEHFLLILSTRYSVEVSAFYHPSSLLQIPLRSQKKSLEILA